MVSCIAVEHGQNEVHDLSAQLLSDVCVDVAIEPTLLPLTGKHIIYSSANIEDGARLDVRGRGFGGPAMKLLILM